MSRRIASSNMFFFLLLLLSERHQFSSMHRRLVANHKIGEEKKDSFWFIATKNREWTSLFIRFVFGFQRNFFCRQKLVFDVLLHLVNGCHFSNFSHGMWKTIKSSELVPMVNEIEMSQVEAIESIGIKLLTLSGYCCVQCPHSTCIMHTAY